MLLYGKDVLGFLTYFTLGWHTLSWSSHGALRAYIVLAMLYYLVLCVPSMQKIFMYNVVDRSLPKVWYLYRAGFHYVLFCPNLVSAFPAVLSVFLLMVWKDIIYLIHHAEDRLAKIDVAMHEADVHKRFSHFYLNVYEDDIKNRFHPHCFDTNKVYLEPSTFSSDRMSLAIYNYRRLRKEGGKKPLNMTVMEKRAYEATYNHSLFLSSRYTFMVSPLLLVAWTMSMTGVRDWNMYINHVLLLLDIGTVAFSQKWNFFIVDLSYLCACVARVLML